MPYKLELHDGEPYSVCPCFIDASTELATMDDLLHARCVNTGHEPSDARELLLEYVAALETVGLTDAREAVSCMLVCDYLTTNSDRHEYSLGAVLDANTKQGVRVAPIFDNGRGFFYGARKAERLVDGLFTYASRPFDEVPERQLRLAVDLHPNGLAWLDFNALDGFAGQVEEALAGNAHLPDWFARTAA